MSVDPAAVSGLIMQHGRVRRALEKRLDVAEQALADVHVALRGTDHANLVREVLERRGVTFNADAAEAMHPEAGPAPTGERL